MKKKQKISAVDKFELTISFYHLIKREDDPTLVVNAMLHALVMWMHLKDIPRSEITKVMVVK